MELRDVTNRELRSILERAGIDGWRFNRLADAAASELDRRRKDHSLADMVCLFACGGVDYWNEIQSLHRSGKERLTRPDLLMIMEAANSYDPFIKAEARALLEEVTLRPSAG